MGDGLHFRGGVAAVCEGVRLIIFSRKGWGFKDEEDGKGGEEAKHGSEWCVTSSVQEGGIFQCGWIR